MFSESEMEICQKFFIREFDRNLRKLSKDYPYIYHVSDMKNLSSISEKGLVNELNYFSIIDETFIHSEEVFEFSCAVDYRKVKHRLFLDPEWGAYGIMDRTGHPESFLDDGIDDRVITCLWVTEILKLDIEPNLCHEKLSNEIQRKIDDRDMFHWVYVRGPISPEMMTVQKHKYEYT